MAEDADAKAERLAAAEGLVLVRSNNKTGFSNVYPVQGSLAGLVRVEVGSTAGGKREHLGSFATAAEAALAYARYLGPERSRALAEKPRAKPPARMKDDHEFGQPRIASSTSHEVACVAADDDDDYDEDDGGLAVVYAESAVAYGGGGSPSDATTTPTAATAAPALKKRRVVHEYELRLGAAAGQRQVTVTIDVPPGATLGTLTAAFDVRP